MRREAKTRLIVGLGAIIAPAAVMAAPAQNPLAGAEAGQVQCFRPDVTRKTCQSIASYSRTGERTYDDRTIVAVSKDATLETHTPAVLRGHAVCSYIRADDMLAGILRFHGAIVSPDAAKPVLEKIAKSVAPFAGKEICTSYDQSADDFTAKVSIAGTYRPDQDVKVQWIGATDGYTVTP